MKSMNPLITKMVNTMSTVNAVSVVENVSVEGTFIGKDEVTILSLAEAFTSGLEKSARGFIEAGRAAYLAKQRSKKEWNEFCGRVAFGNKPSTMNKFIAIGGRYDLFIKYVDKLPSAWTNLYLLTTLSDRIFMELIDAGDITSDLKGFEINRLLGKTPESKSSANGSKVDTSDNGDISVTIKALSFMKADQLSLIVDLAKEEGFEVILSEEYTNYIAAQSSTLAEAA